MMFWKWLILPLKGKFPQTTMGIGWVENNFRNPTVKFWANLDDPFKRTNYAKFCMPPSLDGPLPESVISQENNSPLTLYIDSHNFKFFLDIRSLVDQVQSEMHAQSSFGLTYLNINFWNLCTVSLDSCTVVTSQMLAECHPRWQTRN